VYDEPGVVTRLLRPGPMRGLQLAVSVVAQHASPDVLDLGCGPGRVAEAVVDAGAATYLGIDLSPRMLALARRRLDRFDGVELVEGDFLELDVDRTFDVVLALGLFEYLDEPERAVRWIRSRCSSTLVASFTRWDWVKGPVRHLRYDVLNGCRIVDHTETDAAELLAGAGFSRVEFTNRGSRGFLVCAR